MKLLGANFSYELNYVERMLHFKTAIYSLAESRQKMSYIQSTNMTLQQFTVNTRLVILLERSIMNEEN